ncbi:MAG: sigma-54-dependent Fis family transcriptional regulator [Candidatus Saccharibacteria bacterium]|nr:sigma-54-dependent Fis family transcriptional regulator [Candidatus Saccharibacteria bacterium]
MSGTISVLVVEDEAILLEAYELILGTAGYTVFTARNGIEALEQLKKVTPDVMLLDIFMPEMDGREVLRNLDKADYPEMKIIVCSNLSDSNASQEVLRNGADDFVLKSSLGPMELIQLIKDKTRQRASKSES